MSRGRARVVLLGTLLACTAKSPERERPPAQVFTAEPVRELDAKPSSAPANPAPAPTLASRPVCVPSKRRPGTLELVRQNQFELPERFDPSGRFAALAGDGCEVWELDGEIFLGGFGSPRDSGDCVAWPGGEDPCASWPELVELDLRHVARLRTTITTAELELRIDDTQVRALAGELERYHFASKTPYWAASLRPDEARLALLRTDAIELREVASGTLLAELSLTTPTPPGTSLRQVGLSWSQGLPVAVLGREPGCRPEQGDDCPWQYTEADDPPLWELRRWSNPDTPTLVDARLLTWTSDDEWPATLERAYTDPLGRWLWLYLDAGDEHDLPWELQQLTLDPAAEAIDLDLYVEGIDGEPQPKRDAFGVDDDVELEGRWVTGARTARAWKLSSSRYDGEGSGSDELGWTSMQLWPRPVRSGPHELASDYSVDTQSVEVLGVADERALVAWSHCWSSWTVPALREELDDVGPDGCRGHRPVPSGCEAKGVSDDLHWLLVACGPSWRLIPVGPAAGALEDVELLTARDEAVTAVVGRSGLALAGERSGLKLLAPDGSPRAQEPELTRLLPALLGPELDRVAVRGPTGLTVFDLASARRVADIDVELGDAAIIHAAFAPDGRRLAWTDGRRVSVAELGGARVRSWDAGPVLGLAWRQDGAVLWTGHERALPERAWDPTTGELAATQPDPKFIERLALAELDPSWRWAFEGDDVILRTLDGLALVLEAPDQVASETGLYDGDREPLFVRIVGDREIRVVPLASLPERLHHPDLLADFLAGAELPEPSLTGAELEALD